ncbi:MAG TPA: TorF family putative porin [Xanthobacteraceae bacterium]|nr:TorF family putative porin [Xanthobacteraceae bacterium]
MKRLMFALLAAAALATPALAADMKVKAVKAPPPPPSPWDLAFGDAIMTDYMFRGITQSAHKPSVAVYFEPRYNFTDSLQGYLGLSGESIDFPNHAAAEVDFYGGIRPTFGKLALDFGAWLYYYPGGQCFSSGTATGLTGQEACNAFNAGDTWQGGALFNGNAAKAWASFYEIYGKGTYTISDQWSIGAQVFYSPNVANTGADGTYAAGTIKFTAPSGAPLPADVGFYASADGGYWWLGTSDAFYGVPAFPNGVPYTSYANWDAGFGFTWKVFTLDFRYYGTNLSKADCNAFTSDHTAAFSNDFSKINPTGVGSNWCSQVFVVKLSSDLTLANLK